MISKSWGIIWLICLYLYLLWISKTWFEVFYAVAMSWWYSHCMSYCVVLCYHMPSDCHAISIMLTACADKALAWCVSYSIGHFSLRLWYMSTFERILFWIWNLMIKSMILEKVITNMQNLTTINPTLHVHLIVCLLTFMSLVQDTVLSA